MFVEFLIASVAEDVEESEEVFDALEVMQIEDVKKQLKKTETVIQETSEQFQNLEDEAGLFRGQLSENLCPLLEQEFTLRISEIEKKQDEL